MAEEDVLPDSRICSKHFRDGDRRSVPSTSIGEKFALCPSLDTSRGKRWATRASRKEQQENSRKEQQENSEQVTQQPPQLVTPDPDRSVCDSITGSENSSLIFSPGTSISITPTSIPSFNSPTNPNIQVTVNVAVASQVEILQSENQRLQVQLQETKQAPFSIQCISNDDSLVSLYTGFPSYEVLMSFLNFLALLFTVYITGVPEGQRENAA